MPEPGTKPPSPTKAVALVAAAASAVALLLMWLVLRPPAAHYRTVIAILAVAGIVAGAVLVLASLVRLVEYRFTRRYEDAEAAQLEHRQFVQAHLGVLIAQQRAVDAAIAKMAAAIGAINEQTQSNCKHILLLETQVGRCMSEIGIVAESIDDLREAFVEEGPPTRLTTAYGISIREGSNDRAPRVPGRTMITGARNRTVSFLPWSGTFGHARSSTCLISSPKTPAPCASRSSSFTITAPGGIPDAATSSSLSASGSHFAR
jgi:hypothetical protein